MSVGVYVLYLEDFVRSTEKGAGRQCGIGSGVGMGEESVWTL